jgi:prepilin-type N-terminal cleavage/methylation domain-containing protein
MAPFIFAVPVDGRAYRKALMVYDLLIQGAPRRIPRRGIHIRTNRNHHTMLRKLNTKRAGFTLVEIMIVVAIIALLAAIAVPNFLRSRKRSQATQVLEDLRMLAGALDQYAVENSKKANDPANWVDLQKYIKTGTRLYSSSGNDILGNLMSGTPDVWLVDHTPNVPAATFSALSDVAPTEFWKGFIGNP